MNLTSKELIRYFVQKNIKNNNSIIVDLWNTYTYSIHNPRYTIYKTNDKINPFYYLDSLKNKIYFTRLSDFFYIYHTESSEPSSLFSVDILTDFIADTQPQLVSNLFNKYISNKVLINSSQN